MNSINTTDIAVASGPGADINGLTLILMCSLFGIMKEWLQKGDISMEKAMIYDTDTITQNEWLFSDADCSYYPTLTKLYGECVGDTMTYVPKELHRFTGCILTHFMTERGAKNSCSDDSVRHDSDRNVDTMTLLSKDHHFYSFMVDTLDAGNTCRATNDTVTLSTDDCDWYISLVKDSHAGSKCAYNTPRIDSNTELSYRFCLHYHFMKNLDADSVCARYSPHTNRMTLAYMCSVFGFMKKWFQKGDISTENAMIYDTDTITQNEWLFSDADCSYYPTLTKYYGECVGNTMTYVPKELSLFTGCIITHFMTEMGAKKSCSDDSVRPDSNRNVTTMTLLSKDRHFYSFMADTLDAGNICQATNYIVALSTDDCNLYITLMKKYHAGSRCTYNTPRPDTDTELSYIDCLAYRFMKNLGANSICANRMSLAYMCSMFGFMKELLQKGDISMDNDMIYDTDTITQNEWLFSDADCSYYPTLTRHYGECVGNTMAYEQERLYYFTGCILTHFMTEMGAENSCYDDSVRPDSDRNDKNTMTLLTKDRHFYSFMVDTLNAEKICQATNYIVTLSTDDCDSYIKWLVKKHAGSKCAYNTPRIDSDTELSYRFCLPYHFMKSLGADSACANRRTLAYMCSMFGFMKERLQEGDISTKNSMIYDTDTITQNEWLFSDSDCSYYLTLTRHYGECVGNTMTYEGEKLSGFTGCITTHFMTEMGAKTSCSDDSVRSDSYRNVTTMTLLSKDHHFYSFMVDTLDAGNTCRATNDTVTLSADDCDWYIRELVREHNAGSRCTYNTPRIDSDTELSYRFCLEYHFMKSLGADSVCKDWTLISMCSLFHFMKQLLLEADISTENEMIYDTDTITQNEWLFSDADCSYYPTLTKLYGECTYDTMTYEPKKLYRLTGCTITHFMTEMGAQTSCSDDSVRPDSDRNVTTMTLLSKDHHFYSFMVDTLDAGNTCRAPNDTVTLSADDCDYYIDILVKKHAGSRCAYNTPRIDSDTELSYHYCLHYHFMKSLGADSVCANRMSLAYMCSVFGFMREWMQKGDISMEKAMIYDTDTITQNEWLFSDADCSYYPTLTKLYGECVGDTMTYVPKELHRFTGCILTHFMTEMGAKNSCSDDSVRPDSNRNVTTMTLLSKDRHFHSFMIDTLNAENTCQATNDTVTLSADDCDFYIRIVKQHHAGSRCTYNTPRSDTDTELRYDYCLSYRLMKSLGADRVCKDWTLFSMCSLFGFMEEWLQEAGISTDNTMILDNDTVLRKERWMFSDDDCDAYSLLTKYYGKCAGYSMGYVTDPRWLYGLTRCITTHFMTEMGVQNSCSDDSVRPNNDTDDTNTITLLSKDRLFYTFMVDTLDAGNICQATNDTVTLSIDDCDWYIRLVKRYHAGRRCTYDTPSTDADTELHYDFCLHYRLMKSLGADSVCANKMTLAYMCSLFGFMKEWLKEGDISTENTMVFDTDTTVQGESKFSYADCVDYHWNTKWFAECRHASIFYETDPKRLNRLILCITTHFMTNMGARSSCYDHSVRLDNDTNDKKTVTLLSKDRLFYTFMVYILNKGNMCEATNDNVILSDENCDWYINLMQKDHADSRCAYNTPSIDSDMELLYSKCLQYRFMKSLGVDSVCAQYSPRTNRMTLAYMCSLFGFMKEWLQKDISTENAMIYDTDTITQNEWLFSDADCSYYPTLTEDYGECAGDTMTYETKKLDYFTGCITTHFMTEMGAKNSCYDDSVRNNSDTNDKNTMALLSKDRHFYSFMVETLNAGNTCRAINDTVTLSTDDCGRYIRVLVRKYHAGSRCTYNTPRTDSHTESRFDYCLEYRLMKNLGADSVCKDWTLAYMCSLFGFMKELLQEADISTGSTMILDNDTTAQKEQWMFSDYDCDDYSRLTIYNSACAAYYMDYVKKDANKIYMFPHCITIHFMTEMGARSSCSDDSVRPDSDTNDKNTMTLLSKDRLFYSFMVNTLDAGNICQGINDAVTFPQHDCDFYIRLVRKYHAGSRCTYNTPRTDTDTELRYDSCLGYRFMKSLGADSVCKDWTLISMCSLFGFMKELLQEAGISTENAMILNNDTIAQKERWMFSDDDCNTYWLDWDYYCADYSMDYVTDPSRLYRFTHCITTHFITEMGDRSSCYYDSVRPDSDTNDRNTITLLSKDRLFYSFMVDTLDAGNICQGINVAVTSRPYNCDWYIDYVIDDHAGSRCTYNTPSTDSDAELRYDYCLEYRLLKSLGADSACHVSLIASCDRYHNVVQSMAPTCICVIGVIGNLLSLGMFGSGAVETPIAYQLLWLAGVDMTFIVTWWVVEVLPETLSYYNEKYYLTPYQTGIVSVLTVCLRPLSYVTRSCTVWLTVLIGLYRYLAICKPYGNLLPHCTRHGHRYVVIVVILSFLYNIPHFCEYYLDYRYTDLSYVYDDHRQLQQNYFDGSHGFFVHLPTGLVSKELRNIYSRIHAAVVVGLPCLILSFVTISILVKLRKRNKKKSKMQTSQTSTNSITVMLVTILVTFIISQLPYFVWYGVGGEIGNRDLDGFLWVLDDKEEKKIKGCGSFMYYIRLLVDTGLLLNSSANGFIYFFMNKTFREALFNRCPCKRDDGVETIEMGPVNTRQRPDDAHP